MTPDVVEGVIAASRRRRRRPGVGANANWHRSDSLGCHQIRGTLLTKYPTGFSPVDWDSRLACGQTSRPTPNANERVRPDRVPTILFNLTRTMTTLLVKPMTKRISQNTRIFSLAYTCMFIENYPPKYPRLTPREQSKCPQKFPTKTRIS